METRANSQAAPEFHAKVFLHVDMDAFYAAIEEREHPEYRGKPIVVGSAPDQRGVVSTASYEARKYGIHSAMPSRNAYKRCPDAIFLPVRMALYKKVSKEIFSIFNRYTPLVEALSIDEAFLDVSGSQRLYGTGEEMAAQIKADILDATQLTCSVGVAPNKFLAKLGSEFQKPNGLTVLPFSQSGITRFLRPLPVTRLWGVGKVMQKTLDQAAMYTIGDIQEASLGLLQSIVGAHTATYLRALAFGQDAREIEMDVAEKSISREHTYLQDERRRTTIEDTIFTLVQDVAKRLRKDGRFATTGKLKVRWKNFETITRQRSFPFPTRMEPDLQAMAKALFKDIDMRKPIRLIGFGVTGLIDKPEQQQLGLFDQPPPERQKRERLEASIDRIQQTYGEDSILPARRLRSKKIPPTENP